eukprot:200394_1
MANQDADRPEPVYAPVSKTEEPSGDTFESAASPETIELFKKRESFSSYELLPIVTSLSCGIFFGIGFNKSRIFEPFFIIEQMLMTRFLMLKFFLSAAGTSCFMGVIASHFYPEQFSISRWKFLSLNHALTICLGSLILGAGMTICGSCPGTVFAQLGAGVPNSGYVFIGLLIGALSWGLMEPIWKKLFSGTNTVYMKYIFIEEGLNKKYHIPMSGEVIGILFGVVFWVIVVVFEVLWPWQSELNTPNEAGCNFLSCGSWPPAISGLMVGLTQLPLMTVLGNVLGASSTYMCVMAQWLRLTTESVHDTFPQFKQQLSRRWQILFALAVVFGSWLGVALNSNESNLNVAKHPYDEVEGVNEIRAIVGGFVLEFGSRMCKGCPSGHGFSGFMLLTTASFIAVPSIFAGGISTAFIIQAIGF